VLAERLELKEAFVSGEISWLSCAMWLVRLMMWWLYGIHNRRCTRLHVLIHVKRWRGCWFKECYTRS